MSFDHTPMAPEDTRVTLMRRYAELTDSIDRARADIVDREDNLATMHAERETVRHQIVEVVAPEYLQPQAKGGY